MRPLLLAFLSFASSAAVLLVPALAEAQQGPSVWSTTGEPTRGGPTLVYTRAPQPPASSWDTFGQLGFELEVRGGPMLPDSSSPVQAPNLYPPINGDANGDILTGKEHPYSADVFGLSVLAGYRFLPFLSAGVFFNYANFATQDKTDSGGYIDTTSQLQRQLWQLGAYARYFITGLHPRLQPWVQLGVGFSEDTASYTRAAVSGTAGPPLTQNYYLTHYGVAVPLTIGLDWRLAPVFSVGPTLGYSRVFAVKGCVDSEFQVSMTNKAPTGLGNGLSSCASPPVETSGYGIFFGGIFAKVTFGGAAR